MNKHVSIVLVVTDITKYELIYSLHYSLIYNHVLLECFIVHLPAAFFTIVYHESTKDPLVLYVLRKNQGDNE